MPEAELVELLGELGLGLLGPRAFAPTARDGLAAGLRDEFGDVQRIAELAQPVEGRPNLLGREPFLARLVGLNAQSRDGRAAPLELRDKLIESLTVRLAGDDVVLVEDQMGLGIGPRGRFGTPYRCSR